MSRDNVPRHVAIKKEGARADTIICTIGIFDIDIEYIALLVSFADKLKQILKQYRNAYYNTCKVFRYKYLNMSQTNIRFPYLHCTNTRDMFRI